VPGTPLVMSGDFSAPSNDADAADRRWIAWQHRGATRDARNRSRMAAVAALVVLAVASRVVQIAFGGS